MEVLKPRNHICHLKLRMHRCKAVIKQPGIPNTATKSLLGSHFSEENMDRHHRLVILKGQVVKRRYEMGD